MPCYTGILLDTHKYLELGEESLTIVEINSLDSCKDKLIK